MTECNNDASKSLPLPITPPFIAPCRKFGRITESDVNRSIAIGTPMAACCITRQNVRARVLEGIAIARRENHLLCANGGDELR